MFATAPKMRPGINHSPSGLALLDRFYARLGLPVPQVESLKGPDVPEPYHRLLVHSNDMTPTLESFHRQAMRITVLSREREDGTYLREVLLKTADTGTPVEYGVIRIYLDHLPPSALQAVLDESRPLGNILQTEAIPHLSWPQGFFRVRPDPHLRQVLEIQDKGKLHGRRNLLLDGSRRLLADVVEILPPSD